MLTPVLTHVRDHCVLVFTRAVGHICLTRAVRSRVGRALDVRVSPRAYMSECVVCVCVYLCLSVCVCHVSVHVCVMNVCARVCESVPVCVSCE